MTKNQIILITLISLLDAKALSDTVFTFGEKGPAADTLFETLLGELTFQNSETCAQLYDTFQGNNNDEFQEALEFLLGMEKEGIL